ncbi:P1 family peptidase [uncultured Ferrovibrio sp.]|jgi:L-aminopeptidase/D-esterase-like protein|uniref:P1 family peptidase n=1 Tax=uncultured Ferrovibrio sp. TaxID=1576913 RepID=UPI00262E3297|nr:P1 family peptidase [uncultured Ferrovibrio sp.]
MSKPGPLNLLTDVGGLAVGHAADAKLRSGVTVILPEKRAACSVDVRGGASGTRETDLLRPEASMQAVDAICLSGGSAFGLDAASGVVHWLAKRKRGYSIHNLTVPIVPAAILFDLNNGGDKNWGDEPPYRRLGQLACDNASDGAFPLGNIGAGYGAAAGKLKGGLGSASWVEPDGLVVAALVAVNSVGSVMTPDNRGFWAAPFEQDAEFGGQPMGIDPGQLSLGIPVESRIAGHTCIGVVATNADLDKAALRHVATMAHDGLARAVRPIHTPFDGDTIFSLATATWQDRVDATGKPWLTARIGSIAADCVARAVARGVWAAEPMGALGSAREAMPRS